jgi:hypothetical protein
MNPCEKPDHSGVAQCANCVRSMEDFLHNYSITHMLLNTTFDDDGHKWVRSIDDVPEPDPRILYWCAWCGVHRVEVDDWEKDPPCPAVAAAKKLVPILADPESRIA